MDENQVVKRKCVACGQIIDRKNLIKITKSSSGDEVRINPDSMFFGRSVYICSNKQCVENAFKKGKLFKILKTKEIQNLKEKISAVLEG